MKHSNAVEFSFSKDSSDNMAVKDFLFSVKKLDIKLNLKRKMF